MEVTLMPWNDLPSCATLCGHLWDANGACVPPAQPTANTVVYDKCFCSQANLQPFSTGVTDVCDFACTAPADVGGITSIRDWFTSFCSVANNAVVPLAATTGTNTAQSPTDSALPSSGGGGGGDWVSTHWQWVIFLVVLVVGIAGIWIGACLWRRSYLRRRDRDAVLSKGSVGGPTAPNLYGDKPQETRRWVVGERT